MVEKVEKVVNNSQNKSGDDFIFSQEIGIDIEQMRKDKVTIDTDIYEERRV
tara:strand:+ start:144 stop:296 length:153 start_codon:yes stop_codon:yes gene_type:complete